MSTRSQICAMTGPRCQGLSSRGSWTWSSSGGGLGFPAQAGTGRAAVTTLSSGRTLRMTRWFRMLRRRHSPPARTFPYSLSTLSSAATSPPVVVRVQSAPSIGLASSSTMGNGLPGALLDTCCWKKNDCWRVSWLRCPPFIFCWYSPFFARAVPSIRCGLLVSLVFSLESARAHRRPLGPCFLPRCACAC